VHVLQDCGDIRKEFYMKMKHYKCDARETNNRIF
jgi:hypothetical protein